MTDTLTAAQLEDLYRKSEVTKYFALIARSIFFYDTFITISDEIRLIWGHRWTPMRMIFHVNRVWVTLLLIGSSPRLFMRDIDPTVCLVSTFWHLYGTLFALRIAECGLILRTWAVYDRKRWVLTLLGAAFFLKSIPVSVMLSLDALKHHPALANPAPGVLAWCKIKTDDMAYGPVTIATFVFNTTICFLTMYKVYNTPRSRLMTRLLRDEIMYYLVSESTHLASGVTTLFPSTRTAINGSGLMITIFSCMCSRFILSMRSYGTSPPSSPSVEEPGFTFDNSPYRSSEWNHPQIDLDVPASFSITTTEA